VSRSSVTRAPDLVGLGLALLALAAAGAGQAYVASAPWWGIAGFVAGGVLLALAERRQPTTPEPAPAPPPAFSRLFLVLIAIGWVLCLIAAVLVYQRYRPLTTHLVWLAGLIAFAAAASLGKAQRSERPDRATVLAIAALMLVSFVIFFWQISALPAEVHGDDAEVGLDAVRLLAQFNLFDEGWFELPRFHAFPSAIGRVDQPRRMRVSRRLPSPAARASGNRSKKVCRPT